MDVPEEARTALNIDKTTRCWRIDRLRLADDTAVILEHRYVPIELCPNLSARDIEGSLYAAWTETHNVDIIGADQRIHAISCTDEYAHYFQLPTGSPMLQVLCIGFTTGDTPLWWERTTYRADAYEFRSRLGSQDTGQPVSGHLR